MLVTWWIVAFLCSVTSSSIGSSIVAKLTIYYKSLHVKGPFVLGIAIVCFCTPGSVQTILHVSQHIHFSISKKEYDIVNYYKYI